MTPTAENPPSQPSPATKQIPYPRLLTTLAKAVEDQGDQISYTAVMLYMLLAELGEEGVYPPQPQIAKFLSVARSNIWRAEQALIKLGLLTFIPDGNRTKRYAIVINHEVTRPHHNFWRDSVNLQTRPIVVKDLPDRSPSEPQVVVGDEPVPAEPELPVAPPTPAGETPKVKEKPKPTRLDPYYAQWFLASPDNMALYLRFGVEAFEKPRADAEATLKSKGTDWLEFKPANETYPYDQKWNHNHFMGYFWQGVCRWRAAHNIPLTFPQWGRLAGDIKNLLATMTPSQANQYVFCVITYFDLVRFRAGKIGESLILDEASLNHKIIRDQILLIISHGEHWLQEEYAKMNEALSGASHG